MIVWGVIRRFSLHDEHGNALQIDEFARRFRLCPAAHQIRRRSFLLAREFELPRIFHRRVTGQRRCRYRSDVSWLYFSGSIGFGALRRMMRTSNLHEHADDDTEEATEFRHVGIVLCVRDRTNFVRPTARGCLRILPGGGAAGIGPDCARSGAAGCSKSTEEMCSGRHQRRRHSYDP